MPPSTATFAGCRPVRSGSGSRYQRNGDSGRSGSSPETRRRDRVQDVREHRDAGRDRDRPHATPGRRPDRQRDRTERAREEGEHQARRPELRQTEVQLERRPQDHEDHEQHGGERDGDRGHRERLVAKDRRAPQRRRQEQIERTILLLAGDRARPGADREDQQQDDAHRAEDLAAEVPGRRGVVGPEHVLQRVGQLVDVRLQAGGAGLDAREQRGVQERDRGDPDRPADRRAALVPDALREEPSGMLERAGRGGGAHDAAPSA